MVAFLIAAKAIVLVLTPPAAGWLADSIMMKNKKHMIVYSVGIGATAMVFMVVATLIGTRHLMNVSHALPVMLVVWLVCMNLFLSPANSMIDAFAPKERLPIVMGVLFLVTELLYALEPVIVSIIRFFGDTITFVSGGILVASSGIVFHRLSSHTIVQHKTERMQNDMTQKQTVLSYVAILVCGLFLGLGKAFLVEFLPVHIHEQLPEQASYSGLFSAVLLGTCAIAGFLVSKKITSSSLVNVLLVSFAMLCIGALVLAFSYHAAGILLGALALGIGYVLINIAGLPYVIQQLSIRHLTFGVGIYLGASEVLTGLFEYLYQ